MWRNASYLAREGARRFAVWTVRRCLTPGATEVILAVCGIWCLLTPLLLWLAWTQAIFFFLLGSAATCCVVFCFVAIGAAGIEAEREERASRRPPAPVLPNRRGSLPSWRDHA